MSLRCQVILSTKVEAEKLRFSVILMATDEWIRVQSFAENLVLPNSVMRWKNGIMVTDAPNVLYFEDGDGDGKAEIRDTLLTGFALSNPQHNLNSPLLGIDNWIYLAHEEAVTTETYQKEFGDPGKEIFFPDRPESPRLDDKRRRKSCSFQTRSTPRRDDFKCITVRARV